MDALAALRLQIEWGADEALNEAPVDRLRPAPPTPVQPAASPAAAAWAPGPAIRIPPAERARLAAESAATLPELRDAIAGFGGCALRDTATNTVFAKGDPAAHLLLIGEAPAADDDRAGRPFTGKSGAYLDKMLASIGLDRRDVLLTPLIPWRPPGDRPPSPTELAICLPFLLRLITLSRPRLAVVLGRLASRTLLGPGGPGRVRRGKWVALPGTGDVIVQALPTHSVESVLAQPALRREAWADLRAVRRALDGQIAGK